MTWRSLTMFFKGARPLANPLALEAPAREEPQRNSEHVQRVQMSNETERNRRRLAWLESQADILLRKESE